MHAVPYSTMQYHAVPYSTMQYHAVPCSTIQYTFSKKFRRFLTDYKPDCAYALPGLDNQAKSVPARHATVL